MQDSFGSQGEQNPCVVCNEHHEQMLMLSCVHDPCINCAAKHYVQSQPNPPNIYICSKCGEQTQLDNSSVVELKKIYNLNKRKRKSQIGRGTITPLSLSQNSKNSPQVSYKHQKVAPYQPHENIRKNEREETEYSNISKKYNPPPVSQPSYSSNPKKNIPQLQYPCPDHQQEQLTYFCFTCTQPICPQCAIHGLHKDHQVETTRKAIKQIRSLLAQNKQKLEMQVNVLLQSKEKGKKDNREIGQENKRDQDYIRKKLTHLRNVLSQKEKQLLKSSQVNFEKNIERIKQEELLSDKQLNEIAIINRNIDLTLKKQDLAILQEYNKRDEEVSSFLQKMELDKEKISDYQIKNPHRNLNLSLFDDDMDRILSDIYAVKLSTTVAKQTYGN